MLEQTIKDNYVRNRITLILFWVLCVSTVVLYLVAIWMLLRLEDLSASGGNQSVVIYAELVSTAENIQRFSTFLVLIQLALVIVYWMWSYRSYWNIQQMGMIASYSPSMAVFGWMIPIMWFLLPFQVMREIVSGNFELLSRARGSQHPSLSGYKGLDRLVWIWWFVFLGSTILQYLLNKMVISDLEQGNFSDTWIPYVFITIARFFAIYLALRMVWKLGKMEAEVYTEWEQGAFEPDFVQQDGPDHDRGGKPANWYKSSDQLDLDSKGEDTFVDQGPHRN